MPIASAGQRLDRFLAGARTELTRSRIQGLIRAGRVTVNGKTVRASRLLRAGDELRLEVPDPEPTGLLPEDLPLNVIYEDDHLAVVDKPAGMVVHPGAGVSRGTLVHALVHRYPSIEGVGGVRRPGLVHRLDKDTSGLMVVAKTETSYHRLVAALAARTLKRTYSALVWGEPGDTAGVLEAPIGRDPRHRQRMAVVTRGGKPARTRFRVEERFGIAALLRVELDTGRTHQIRVHLAWAGHPVVGDPVYGGRAKMRLSESHLQRNLARELLDGLGRQGLHAAELEFQHPVTGAPLHLQSPLPEELLQALRLLRARSNQPPR